MRNYEILGIINLNLQIFNQFYELLRQFMNIEVILRTKVDLENLLRLPLPISLQILSPKF